MNIQARTTVNVILYTENILGQIYSKDLVCLIGCFMHRSQVVGSGTLISIQFKVSLCSSRLDGSKTIVAIFARHEVFLYGQKALNKGSNIVYIAFHYNILYKKTKESSYQLMSSKRPMVPQKDLLLYFLRIVL